MAIIYPEKLIDLNQDACETKASFVLKQIRLNLLICK